MPKPLGKILLALAAASVAALCFEGVLSLAFQRTLRRGGFQLALPASAAERAPGIETRAAGPYRRHPDPRVSYVLRPDADLTVAGARVASDALGLRARPGGPPAAGAFRIVVLGDSIAFGQGVGDAETLAARLELHLNAARTGAGPEFAALTAAMPGWNHRNSAAFLQDHAGELLPDLALFVPVGNDLADSLSIGEDGSLAGGLDFGSDDPWLFVDFDQVVGGAALALELAQREGRKLLRAELGPQVLNCDALSFAARRFAAAVDSLASIAAEGRRHGFAVAVAACGDDEYATILRDRAQAALPALPWLTTIESLPADMAQPGDPHPNAVAVDAMARILARHLVAAGLVSGVDAQRIPAASDHFTAAAALDREQVRREADRRRAACIDDLGPALEPRSGTGLFQAFGGLNADGSIGPTAEFALARRGDTLRLTLAPLWLRPSLYPMRIEVEIDGTPVGSLEVAPPSQANANSAEFALPPRLAAARSLEVRLRCERFAVIDFAGRARLASCALVAARCE